MESGGNVNRLESGVLAGTYGPISPQDAINRRINRVLHGNLFNHLGRLIEDLGRDGDAELLGGIQVDHELELRRLFDG